MLKPTIYKGDKTFILYGVITASAGATTNCVHKVLREVTEEERNISPEVSVTAKKCRGSHLRCVRDTHGIRSQPEAP